MKSITLADGPHLLDVPRVPAFIYLQRLGYHLEDMFWLAFFVRNDDGEVIDADLKAVADHLCALLIASEPQVGWTPETVAEQMVLASITDYIDTLRDLATEGSGGVDPKASSETIPEPQP